MRRPNINSNTSKWSCDIVTCGKNFKKKSHLTRHKLVHSGERPYHCSTCGKTYSRQEHLNRHQLTHSGGNKFKCQQTSCGKAFVDRSHLKRHEWTHAKPHRCDVCGNAFNKFSQLLKHKMGHEFEVVTSERTQYRCPHTACTTFYTSMSGLRKHLKAHESSQRYLCSGCHKRYIKFSELRTHRNTAHCNATHKCHICHKKFDQLNRMTVHMKRVHKGDDETVDIGLELSEDNSSSLLLENAEDLVSRRAVLSAENMDEQNNKSENQSRCSLGESESDAVEHSIKEEAPGVVFVDSISLCETI